MFTFLHAADIHLDSPLRGLEQYEGAPVAEMRAATRRALENLVELAIQEAVDFVLIAGDLYDGDWKDHNTGLFFVSQMTKLREAKIPVVMIRGNHDAASRITKSLRLPENVEVLAHSRSQTATTATLQELGVAVHGRSFASAAELENLVGEYPARRSGLFNIGLLHTSLTGADGHERYAPCTLDDLRQKEYDYWALGHVHNRGVRCEEPCVVYPGNLQGRHIRETGPKGCCLVAVDNAAVPRVDFRPLDVCRWAECPLDAENVRDPEELLNRFSKQLQTLAAEHAGLPLAVRVVVTGDGPARSRLLANPRQWINELRAAAVDVSSGSAWIEKVKFPTPTVRPAHTALADGPLGELFRCLDEVRHDPALQSELAEELGDLRRKLPDELLSGDDSLGFDDADAWRSRLEEVQQLLLERLSGGAGQ